MIGDKVNIKPKHTQAATAVLEMIGTVEPGTTFTVAGQSGAGKSETAHELGRLLEEAGLKAFVFAQDDYFLYPPKTNHNRRVDDIQWVGTQEVNTALLGEHLEHFKNARSRVLEKPLVVFDEDRITSEKVDLSPFNVAIAEGTYTTLLDNVDYKVFIARNYFDTLEDRKERGREKIDDFSEQIMKIEDAIISKHEALADFIIDKNFNVTRGERKKD